MKKKQTKIEIDREKRRKWRVKFKKDNPTIFKTKKL